MAVVEINGNGSNLNGSMYLNPQLQSILVDEDFVSGALTGTTVPATATNSGAVAFFGAAGRHGVVSCTTGAVSAAGACALGTNGNTISFGNVFISFDTEIFLPNLSDGSETFTVLVGYGDNLTSAPQTDGIFFRYTHTENGGRWTLVCERATVETTLDSGVAAVANTWTNLKIQTYNSTSATFYINDINVGTISTNLPTSAEFTGVNIGIYKSVGTSTRALRSDWVYIYAIHGSR